MWLGSGIAVAVAWASGYCSKLTHSLGTSICCGYGPEKKKKKNKKQRTKVATMGVFSSWKLANATCEVFVFLQRAGC